ncbi:transglutaminase-like domain-containing protein [Pseudomonas sp. P3C3]
MTRLVCSIITASSLLISSLAAAQDIELTIRVRNERAAVVSGAQLCGLLPIAENGIAGRWQVSGPEGLQAQAEGYCQRLNEMGPYQSQSLQLRWSPFGEAGGNPVTPDYPLLAQPSTELRSLAESFSRYPEEERPRRIYDWMVDNIEFSGIRRGVDGAEHALSQRRGDCTEHMLLAAELMARNGFVVRRVLGVALSADQKRISANGLHNWLEYQDNQEWRIFDSSRRIFIEPGGQRYISLLHYRSSQQLSIAPVTVDAQGLKLYLE